LEGGGCERRDLAMAAMRSRQREWTVFGEGAGPLRLESLRRAGPRQHGRLGRRRLRVAGGLDLGGEPLPAAASEAVVVAAAVDRMEAAAAAAPIHALASRTRRHGSIVFRGGRARRVAATAAMMAGGPRGIGHESRWRQASSPSQ
jgi:hypothetical protein